MQQEIKQEMTHHYENELLRRDVKVLGDMLGEILVSQEGQELLDTVERIRNMAKTLRDDYSEDNYEALKSEIASLDFETRKKVIRAFAVFFHLANIAEQNFRVRRRRQYQLEEDWVTQPLSIENAVESLIGNNVDAETIKKALSTLSLELVTTAHPTESTKRTILDIKKGIAEILKKLDQDLLTNRERNVLNKSLFNDIAILWQSDELRSHKPTVLDEVKSGLYYFDQTLFDVLPEIHTELEANLIEHYPEASWEVPNFLSFGTWIGGDRDGNPFVTHDVTWETMVQQRALTLKKYKEVLKLSQDRYSQATTRAKISDDFIKRLEEMEERYLTKEKRWPVPEEVYRRYFAVLIERIEEVGNSELGYKTADEFLDDLHFVQGCFRKHHPSKHELKTLHKLIRQVQLFGFHLASLDIRNHSGEHEAAISEMLKKVGLADKYAELSEEKKVETLLSVLSDPRRILLGLEDYTPETQEMISVFQTIKRIHDEFGQRAISVYLISMSKTPSDILEVLVMAKEAGLYRLHADGEVESHLNIAPLFETIDDLKAAPGIMETLFNIPLYRHHLQILDNRQEVMFGYSDSSKDGGNLAANWRLYKAQMDIHKMAISYDINLKFFHGRGGSLGRGGGPLHKSLMSQPAETIDDGVKITEQGEVLSYRYLVEDIAYRSLEQAVAALLQISTHVLTDSDQGYLRKDTWVEAFEEIAKVSHSKYRSLVFEDPGFMDYFYEATPLNEFGGLNIGSRPMVRKSGRRFEYLRAIPWVFAWTQSRHMLPAWYAAGTGLTTFAKENPDNLALMQEMYDQWPFFRNVIDNLQLALMRADIKTAKEYTTLVNDQEAANRIFTNIEEEYKMTEEIVLKISRDEVLLEQASNARDSSIKRKPYMDTLNFLQVALIKELRSAKEPDDELMVQTLLTINGISAGLRNTG